MRKNENNKAKKVNITGKRIWTAAIVINVIPVLIKLFNVLYFKHSFGEEFNYPYFNINFLEKNCIGFHNF